MYLSSKIFNGRIVPGKNTAFDRGKMAILPGKLFFIIFNSLYFKVKTPNIKIIFINKIETKIVQFL